MARTKKTDANKLSCKHTREKKIVFHFDGLFLVLIIINTKNKKFSVYMFVLLSMYRELSRLTRRRCREIGKEPSCIDMCVMKFYLYERQTITDIHTHMCVYLDSHIYGRKNMNHNQYFSNCFTSAEVAERVAVNFVVFHFVFAELQIYTYAHTHIISSQNLFKSIYCVHRRKIVSCLCASYFLFLQFHAWFQLI